MEIAKRKKRRKQEPKLFLSQIKLKLIREIIRNYFILKDFVDLDVISHKTFPEFDKNRAYHLVSKTHSFLLGIGILEGGEVSKRLTKNGNQLGYAILWNLDDEEKLCWQTLIKENQVCVQIVNSVYEKGEVTREGFQREIYRYAGYRDQPRDISIGANALIDILCKTGYVQPMHKPRPNPRDRFKATQTLQYISTENANSEDNKKIFINTQRINELEGLQAMVTKWDLSRLVKYCHEINDNYARENYVSVTFLCRSFLYHFPPIFGYRSIQEFVSNTQEKEFRSTRETANKLLLQKYITDLHIHKPISKKEILPNKEEIDFSQSFNFLLNRIIEKLSEELNDK